jgi:hypothetical protein
MKTTAVLQIAMIALATACTACTTEDATTDSSEGQLTVQASLGDTGEEVGTRSITTAFSSSTIGVFVAGDGYAPTMFSTCVVTDGVAASPSPAISLNATATVYGFYPAYTTVGGSTLVTLASPTSASIIPVTVLASDDFSSTNQIDYMYAVAGASVSKAVSNVTLTFHHALSMLTIMVKTESYGGTGNLTNIELRTADGATYGYFQTGTTAAGSGMAVSGGTITGLSSSTTTSLSYAGSVNLTTASTIVATLLVAPQTIPTDTKVYLTIDGQPYSVALPRVQATAWAKGTNYTYPLKVTGGTLSVDGTVTISNWTPNTAEAETTVN